MSFWPSHHRSRRGQPETRSTIAIFAGARHLSLFASGFFAPFAALGVPGGVEAIRPDRVFDPEFIPCSIENGHPSSRPAIQWPPRAPSGKRYRRVAGLRRTHALTKLAVGVQCLVACGRRGPAASSLPLPRREHGGILCAFGPPPKFGCQFPGRRITADSRRR